MSAADGLGKKRRILLLRVSGHDGGPTPIGGGPLDVIRYIAPAFLSDASAATLSRSQNSGVSELSEPEGGHPA